MREYDSDGILLLRSMLLQDSIQLNSSMKRYPSFTALQKGRFNRPIR